MKRDTDIAYQNKDIISKLFGDRMKGKPISLFGLDSSLKVVDIRPTNIPLVQAKELRMDNVFELEDGSLAILDYESTYKKENFLYHRKLRPMIQKRSAMDAPRANGRCCLRQPRLARSVCRGTHFLKYGFYVLHVADRYLKEGEEPDIHMMVLYTADIENASSGFHRSAMDMRVEAAYFVGVDSDAWMREVREGVENQAITDEILMHLVLLPLTYKGDEEKQTAIKVCVDLACQMEDKEKETFALAGILYHRKLRPMIQKRSAVDAPRANGRCCLRQPRSAQSVRQGAHLLIDKVISKENRERIKEVLGMTQVGMMIFQDGWEKGQEAGLQKGREEKEEEMVLNLFREGIPYEQVSRVVQGTLSDEKLRDLQKRVQEEACAAV